MTSTQLRHRFFLNRMSAAFDVVGAWQEEKSFVPARYAASDEDAAIIGAHFAARDAAEADAFAAHTELGLRDRGVHRVPPGGINDPDEIRRMASSRPDVMLVFGTGLLAAPLIETFSRRIVNLHLGLSPYYRGAGTNFWPLVNREPEYVGATIHFLDQGIDTGPIIAHVRPAIRATDGPHEIGNDTIRRAAEAMTTVVPRLVAGEVVSRPQNGRGRLYQRKDFTAAAVQQLYRNFETGMVVEYLADRRARDAALNLSLLEPHE